MGISWFISVGEMAAVLRSWSDWSPDGLLRYWQVVRATMILDLLLSKAFCFNVRRNGRRGNRRYADDFVDWAVNWLSGRDGKAVPHV